MLLRVEDEELLLPVAPSVPGPAEVRWVLTNALFRGDTFSLHNGPGTSFRRADTLSCQSSSKEWVLRLLPSFGDAERVALVNGVAKQLPTAELVTSVADISELPSVENTAYAVTRLLSLATGSSVAGGIRRIYQSGQPVAESFFEWSIFGGAESTSFSGFIVNDGVLGNALTRFLNEAIPAFERDDQDLRLSNVIGYLEQARTTPVIEAKIVMCILALETLTYRLCLRLGRTSDELASTNIQQKLNTVRGRLRMGFIDKRFAEEARESLRNPLMHSGAIPTLQMPEKVRWADDLYALTFRMLIFLLGYQGQWLDPSSGWLPTNAPSPT